MINNKTMIPQELRLQQFSSFLRTGAEAAQFMFYNTPDWRGNVSYLLNDISEACSYSNKDKLKNMVETWKTVENAKIVSCQNLSNEQKEHLKSGVNWFSDALKWGIEETFSQH